MRARFAVLLVAMSLIAMPLSAQDLASTCHASSSYDVTINPDDLVFDRPSPAPLRVELRQGALRVDGATVPLGAENQDRLVLFERELRALVPRVRTVAQNGVDLAVRGILAETAGLGLSPGVRAEFAQRLARHAGNLKQRIASIRSTHDLQDDVASRYEHEMLADLAPLVAGDLGQQAVDAALNGDLQAAAVSNSWSASSKRTCVIAAPPWLPNCSRGCSNACRRCARRLPRCARLLSGWPDCNRVCVTRRVGRCICCRWPRDLYRRCTPLPDCSVRSRD